MKRILLTTPRFTVIKEKPQTGSIKYYLEKPNAVGIVLLKNKKIGLLKIKRQNVKGISLEIAGGRVELGETPYEAANRELVEELAIKDARLDYLTEIYPLPSVVNEKLYIYIADIERKRVIPNREEGIEGVVFYTFNEIVKLVMNNRVQNCGDAYALLYFLVRREKYGETIRD